MNKDVKIVPVDKSNGFVGIKIDEGIVKVFVPRVFREDEDWKKDIRLFLKSIEIAKTKNAENINKGSNNTDNAWPIDSYLWLINDYLENGLYYNREKHQHWKGPDTETNKSVYQYYLEAIFHPGNLYQQNFCSGEY